MTAGRPRGYPKSGGARKGSIRLHTTEVKEAVKRVFFDDLGGEKFLRKVAKENPSLFLSLVARLIPQEVRAELDVNHNHVDLGAAMRVAQARLDGIKHQPGPIIDVTPRPDAKTVWLHREQLARAGATVGGAPMP